MVAGKQKSPSSDSQTLKPSTSRIIIITADKGGTGKTMFARVLAHFLIDRGIQTLTYEADPRNVDLERYYGKAFPLGVKRMNFASSSDVNAFLDRLEETYQVVLLHLPGGAGEFTEVLESKLKLSDIAAENNYRITFVSVLNRGRECLNSLRSLVDTYGDRADYVVVKNLHHGIAEKFRRFDNSKTKEILQSLNAKMITLPDLDDDVVDFIDGLDGRGGFTFQEASTKGIAPNSVRAWTHSFLSDAEVQLNLAAEYLGL